MGKTYTVWQGELGSHMHHDIGAWSSITSEGYIQKTWTWLLSGKEVPDWGLQIVLPSVRACVCLCLVRHLTSTYCRDVICSSVSCLTFHKAVSLLLNHHKLLWSITVFARHRWPIGLFIWWWPIHNGCIIDKVSISVYNGYFHQKKVKIFVHDRLFVLSFVCGMGTIFFHNSR